jgi:transposase InsO family protein
VVRRVQVPGPALVSETEVEAKVVIEDWRREYDEVRPHSSLGKLTPTEFARSQSTSKILGRANF